MEIRKVLFEEIEDALTLIEEYAKQKSRQPSQEQIAQIYSLLTESGGCIIGAFYHEILIGTCTLNVCPNFSWSGRPYAMIENVIVSKLHRNKGVGKAILSYTRELAREAGCYKVALMTGSKQNSTLKFYESSGFTGNKIGFQSRFNS